MKLNENYKIQKRHYVANSGAIPSKLMGELA